MEFAIKKGYCYQVINNLIDVASPFTASMPIKQSPKGDVEISKNEALYKGYQELAYWSMPDHKRLCLINNLILVCSSQIGITAV